MIAIPIFLLFLVGVVTCWGGAMLVVMAIRDVMAYRPNAEVSGFIGIMFIAHGLASTLAAADAIAL